MNSTQIKYLKGEYIMNTVTTITVEEIFNKAAIAYIHVYILPSRLNFNTKLNLTQNEKIK